jgi:hypothetical protein
MELVPSVAWADAATQHDLRQIDRRFDELEARLDARFDAMELRLHTRLDKGFRQIMVTMFVLYVSTVIGVAVAFALR